LEEKAPIRVVGPATPKSLGELGDDDLMLLSASGRHDAFESLMRRHQTLVFGLATRYLGDKGSGRDVAQDVFLALWAERDRYRPQGRFRSYLVSMTLHRCDTVARKSKNYDKRLGALARETDSNPNNDSLPLDQLVEKEKARRVRQLLTQLPEKHRQTLVLRFAHDLAFEEISEATKTPVGTVKSHAFRGLKKLRTLLSKGSSR
jgi:RNA polymerase sigma-70 factor (ECF subfamily)